MTATCVFCRKPSGDSRTVAHLIPETLVPNGVTLAAGVECDRCNAYAGEKLEPMLTRHPLLSMVLQLAGVPGKSGKPRRKLGVFERGAVPGMTVTFPVEPPTFYYGPDGHRRWSMSPVVDPGFDYARFSRALHWIALRALAHVQGPEAARSGEFDAVRRFVREPVNGRERWTYVELCQQMQTLERRCSVEHVPFEDARLARLRLYNLEYYVDLANTGALLTTRFAGQGLSAKVVSPDSVPPEPKPLEAAPDGMVRRYRASIE